MALHKRFKLWDEATTFTRYLAVAFFGAAFYEFSIDAALYMFLFSLLLNGFCHYSMETTLEDIVKDRISHNYGDN